MAQIEFSLPDDDTPGYLENAIQALEFVEQLDATPTAESLRNMARFLAQFVSQPEDPDEKYRALLKASKRQDYLEMVKVKIEGQKQYPEEARTRHIEGRVSVRFTITPEGHIGIRR